MVNIVVERTFPQPLSEAELGLVERRMKPCLELYRVRYVRSFWSQDHRRMICHYQAPDAEAVRQVQSEAGALFDTVWTAQLLGDAD